MNKNHHSSRSRKEKIEYGAQFIPSRHKERGTNISSGGSRKTCDTNLGLGSSGSASRKQQFLKIVVIGDSGVGKSSIIESYQYKKPCLSHKPTIGADFIKKKVKIKSGEVIPLQIWDTAGQERFQSLSNTFYRGADCCVIVYDITNRDSYEGIEQWRNNFMESVIIDDYDDDSREQELMVPIILVGNKLDLSKSGKRQVEQRQARADWVDSGEAIEYHETSALSMKNIEKLFESIADQANDYQQNVQEQRETINDLQDQYANITDIQSQLLLPNKRYTAAAAQRNSNVRYSNMRNSNMHNFQGRNSRKSVHGHGYGNDSIEDHHGSTHDGRSEERSSYYTGYPRQTCSMELEPDIESDKYGNSKIRLTAIKEGQEEQSKCCF